MLKSSLAISNVLITTIPSFYPVWFLQIPVLEMFLVLALYSSGYVKDRMKFCFEVFDDDGSGELDKVIG